MLNLVQSYHSGRLSQVLLWVACIGSVAGLLAARSFVAIGPLVGILAVLTNPNLRRDLPGYYRNGAAMRALALVAFLLLTSLYTSDWAAWRHEVFRYLPWIAVPLAFTLAVPLSASQRLFVGAFFVFGTAVVGLATMAKYLIDPAAANEAIRVGQNMQAVTRIFHISFGLMLALSFFWGLLLRRHPLANRGLRGLMLGAALTCALTVHVLAYRTGLVLLYTGLLAYALPLLGRRRQALVGIGLLLLVAAGPWLAYRTLNSVRERVDSTIWDVQQYTLGHDINDYSLARRLAALETAGNVIRKNWLLGVGPADTHAALMDQYSWEDFGLRVENRVDVHNQYIEALLGGGIVGLLVWLAVLLWPLTRSWARRNAYIGFFILLQATVMLWADVLSLQISLNLFIFGYGFLVVAGEADRNRERSGVVVPDEA
ncbi:O-antigen ligase family protein [Hymenobacter sp. BT175]|uniref:O-antigen ligase family protein n=1 Tax=Hymenobacter translucens TaxID=2886507 RepID=UPI001D0E9C0D|nr:O-antigen ligase family protein [Hymenobacter translucens]MCC2545099.1 O-antigen ligase family protein [Hymenobacter translucens]